MVWVLAAGVLLVLLCASEQKQAAKRPGEASTPRILRRRTAAKD